MTDIERARQRKELRHALARSLTLSKEPCPRCGTSWSLHTVTAAISCSELLYTQGESK